MSLPAGLKFSSAGALGVQAVAPTEFVGGVGVINGVLTTDPGAPVAYPNGNPCVAAGNVCDVAPGAGPFSFQNGFKYDSTGRLVTADVGVAAAPLSSQNGRTFDANSALVTVAGDTISDPFWPQVVLSVALSGVNNATAGFTDVSSYARTLTGNNGCKESNAQTLSGRPTSIFFDGVDDFIDMADAPEFFLNQAGMSYTIEAWVWIDSTGSVGGLFCRQALDLTGGYESYFVVVLAGAPLNHSLGAGAVQVSAAAFVKDAWNHAAVSKNGGLVKFWVNGVGNTAVAISGEQASQGTATRPRIGLENNNTAPFKGGMDGLRITKGVARYWASNFTPPTVPYPTS